MATQPPEINRLMDNARMHLPGALDDALKLELFNTLDEFLQKSKFWQEDIDYTASPGRTAYELVGTEQGAIVDLITNVNTSGGNVPASMSTLGTVDLRQAPSNPEVYTATVAYTVVDPTGADSFPQFPDMLLYKYGAGILAGLIGRMMAQPAKPYTNEQLAVFHTRKFNGVTANARAEVRHRNVYGGQAWGFPTFAHGSQRR